MTRRVTGFELRTGAQEGAVRPGVAMEGGYESAFRLIEIAIGHTGERG
jgi:hypothetical protein